MKTKNNPCKCKTNIFKLGEFSLCLDCFSIHKDKLKLPEEDWLDIPLETRREFFKRMESGKYQQQVHKIVTEMFMFFDSIIANPTNVPWNSILHLLTNIIISKKLTENENQCLLVCMAVIHLMNQHTKLVSSLESAGKSDEFKANCKHILDLIDKR